MTKTKENEKAAPLFAAKDLYEKLPDIQAAQAKAEKAGNKLQLEYHRIACSLLVHLAKHGDIMPIRQMLAGFPQSLRLDAMQKFLVTFGPISQRETEDGKTEYVLDRSKELQLGAALEPKNAWWKVKAVSEYKPYDLIAELEKMLERSENKLTKGVSAEKGDKLTHDQVSNLRIFVNHLKSTSENVVAMPAPKTKVNAPAPAKKVAAKRKAKKA